MVEVELGELLEEKLRRLVELGLYPSLSEAIRDAVRKLLDQLDLKSLALELYLNTDASFQYITEFAGASYEDMIEYFISKGILPLLGVLDQDDVAELTISEKYVLDKFTIYIMYKSGLFKFLRTLSEKGYVFLAPSSISSWTEVLLFRQLISYAQNRSIIRFFDTGNIVISGSKVKLTIHEQYAIYYALKNKDHILISDDIRTRKYAKSLGVRALSSLSVLYTLRNTIAPEELEEAIFKLKTIPLNIPDDLVRGFGIAV